MKLGEVLVIWLWFMCSFPYLVRSRFDDPCVSRDTCSECIQRPTCAWCMQSMSDQGTGPRCFQSTNDSSLHCPVDKTQFSENGVTITSNMQFSNTIHMNLQKASLHLRPHVPYNITVSYLKAEGHHSWVKLKDNATREVTIKYYSKCSDELEPEVQTNKCDNVEVGKQIQFTLEFELREYPRHERDHQTTIQVYPEGVDNVFMICLSMLCSCPCEHNTPFVKNEHNVGIDTSFYGYEYEENSPKCHHGGTYKCGICECDETRTGRTCECSTEIPYHDAETVCKPDNVTTEDCSGRGQCVCGNCLCDTRQHPAERIYGTYCECDNFSCERINGYICGGPMQGICDCGTCKCLPPWTGSACDCFDSDDTCYSSAVENPEICSGHGVCRCGKCHCDESYIGDHCEYCTTCPTTCDELKPCVECQMFKTGPLNMTDCIKTCTYVPNEVEIVIDLSGNAVVCETVDEFGCQYTFAYKTANKLEIFVSSERKCSD